MKTGTTQKIILNMISTTAMVKCGYVYENLEKELLILALTRTGTHSDLF